MKKLLFTLSAVLLAGHAWAKLPPLTEEAKAKAAETAAKTAWTNKTADYQLCQAQNKVAARYFAEAKAAGKPASASGVAPACADPGPFVYAAPDTKPIEAAGAHSPPATASGPPSTTTPDAALQPAKK